MNSSALCSLVVALGLVMICYSPMAANAGGHHGLAENSAWKVWKTRRDAWCC